jgi:hypothetical protein
MKKITCLILTTLSVVIILSVNISNVNAQRLKPGPQDLSFFSTVDETDQPYAVYIPKNFDDNWKIPAAAEAAMKTTGVIQVKQ